jgi:hypothetical protein
MILAMVVDVVDVEISIRVDGGRSDANSIPCAGVCGFAAEDVLKGNSRW